ncbi:peptidoglycan-binding protein [Paracoccus pacificus]|uniref:Peptidoglycan-binding protein n=1 Tax=Paracoccus pacificus TaxID=1463598 RepID=A0ABW4R2Y1_9RHOB
MPPAALTPAAPISAAKTSAAPTFAARSRRSLIAALMLTCAGAMAAHAESRAIVIGNSNYDNAPDVPGAEGMAPARKALNDAGFRVIGGDNVRTNGLREDIEAFIAPDNNAGPRIILLAGRFVRSANDSWFISQGADRPSLSNADTQGVSLSVLMDALGRRPGQSVILLGNGGDGPMKTGLGIASGLGDLRIPEGVTVVTGTPADMVRATQMMVTDGRRFDQLGNAGRSVRVMGYRAPGAVLGGNRPGPSGGGNTGNPGNSSEADAWNLARKNDSIEQYRAYLRAYPNGSHADAARERIFALGRNDDVDRNAVRENDLLNRDQRRQVQRNLTLLGYDTRGADGIFGSATRRAIRDWQARNNLSQTGYLTERQQIVLLSEQSRKAADLRDQNRKDEAARIEAADRRYWADVGSVGGAQGLRAYLSRYPNGIYAKQARQKLAELGGGGGGTSTGAGPREAEMWRRTQDDPSARRYRDYLNAYPNGVYAKQARAALNRLEKQQPDPAKRPNPATTDAAKAEAALGLTDATRQLIEGRLAAAGVNPGKVDGKFDGQTRNAIRVFQRARNLPATGYMDQATVVQLLAQALR